MPFALSRTHVPRDTAQATVDAHFGTGHIMRAEVDVLRLLRARTDVPVPEVLAHDTSRKLIDHDYYLMSYVPGVSLFEC